MGIPLRSGPIRVKVKPPSRSFSFAGLVSPEKVSIQVEGPDQVAFQIDLVNVKEKEVTRLTVVHHLDILAVPPTAVESRGRLVGVSADGKTETFCDQGEIKFPTVFIFGQVSGRELPT